MYTVGDIVCKQFEIVLMDTMIKEQKETLNNTHTRTTKIKIVFLRK